ncbi:MAG: zf-HC2 domain-containing protein [Planctomycetes bacterium]|nr:zf-HC2 domain-containing protein [Planctomycetota bacterium]
MSTETSAGAREISCEECRDLLSDYVDKELDEGGRASVEKHLATCEKCSGESSILMGLKNVIQNWDGVSGSDAFKKRTMDQYIRESQMVPSKQFTDAAAQSARDQADPEHRKALNPVAVIGGAVLVAALLYVLIRFLKGG